MATSVRQDKREAFPIGNALALPMRSLVTTSSLLSLVACVQSYELALPLLGRVCDVVLFSSPKAVFKGDEHASTTETRARARYDKREAWCYQ